MKKYFLISFLILAFGFVCFSQESPQFKIEDFVSAKILPGKTVIFVGDRFELKLDVVYLKGVGIKILIEDFEKDSMAAFLPDSIILEKATISKPIPWNDYWLKIEATYILFYPEKKHNAGIMFFPQDAKPLKIRFKWVDEEDKNIQENVELYEVGVRPSQFILGVRSMLTDTSNSPRDEKLFFGNFSLKYWIGMVVGFALILFAISVPIRKIIVVIKNQRKEAKKTSLRRLLKNERRKLRTLRKSSDLKEFSDSFCLILRNIIGIKTGLKTKSMTVAEIKTKTKTVLDIRDNLALINLVPLLEQYEDYRYNPEMVLTNEEKERALSVVEEILSDWTQYPWYRKLKKAFGPIIKIITARKGW